MRLLKGWGLDALGLLLLQLSVPQIRVIGSILTSSDCVAIPRMPISSFVYKTSNVTEDSLGCLAVTKMHLNSTEEKQKQTNFERLFTVGSFRVVALLVVGHAFSFTCPFWGFRGGWLFRECCLFTFHCLFSQGCFPCCCHSFMVQSIVVYY